MKSKNAKEPYQATLEALLQFEESGAAERLRRDEQAEMAKMSPRERALYTLRHLERALVIARTLLENAPEHERAVYEEVCALAEERLGTHKKQHYALLRGVEFYEI